MKMMKRATGSLEEEEGLKDERRRRRKEKKKKFGPEKSWGIEEMKNRCDSCKLEGQG